ncbi:MAG: methylmalonyl Co-A mutase-associated GTPase MeaB [Firmicutes bacterium]|nr:methylmalonyl Co-A mutase-associated GTPase MeaB [Bacillota bacterium]
MDIVDSLLRGDRRALAKAITLVENERPEGEEILREIHPHTGNAYIIGFTGSPGSGKSSLVDALVNQYRMDRLKVGVIAVDPTSPFTGGALLGDRIRMQKHTLDEGVFIRSMGTRGNLGGLARTTKNVARIIDAFGVDILLIETVGVGQSEIDIIKVADTSVLVLTPAGGDSVQAIKAGVMEIADVLVVNKSDLPNANRTRTELELALELDTKRDWRPLIVQTITFSGQGIEELKEAIDRHRNYLQQSGEFINMRRQRIRQEVMDNLEFLVKTSVWEKVIQMDNFEKNVDKILKKEKDPISFAKEVLAELGKTFN